MGRADTRKTLRGDNNKANQTTLKLLCFILTILYSFSALAAAAADSDKLTAVSSVTAAGTKAASPRRHSLPPITLSVREGGESPVIQTVQRYINPTYLKLHTMDAFDSSGGDLIVM